MNHRVVLIDPAPRTFFGVPSAQGCIVSAELERAKSFVQAGKHKKALSALWVVEARARTDLAEAQGLADVATDTRPRDWPHTEGVR
jgi:hypothetical protein